MDAKPYTDAEWANARLNTGASGKMWESAVLTVDTLKAERDCLRAEIGALNTEIEATRIQRDDWMDRYECSHRNRMHADAALLRVERERDEARAEVEGLRDERDEWRRKQQHSREQNHALNERAQRAEGIIAKSGIVEGRPQGANGRSLGRALANYAAAQYRRERDEARDRVRGLEALLREARRDIPDPVDFVLACGTWSYVLTNVSREGYDARRERARRLNAALAPPEEPDCRGHDHSATAPHDCGGS